MTHYLPQTETVGTDYVIDNLQDYDYLVWTIATQAFPTQEYNAQTFYFKSSGVGSYSRNTAIMLTHDDSEPRGSYIHVCTPYVHYKDLKTLTIPDFMADVQHWNVEHPKIEYWKDLFTGTKFIIRVYGIKIGG